MKRILFLVGLIAFCFNAIAQPGVISTIAGNGTAGYSGDGGNAATAALNTPGGMATDYAGNVYFADTYNHRIRKITRAGIITTFAGTGGAGSAGDGGQATNATLYLPVGITIDPMGNMYVVEEGGNTVRKINTAGIITHFAGTGIAGLSGDNGPATAAKLNHPQGVAIDLAGNVYISDQMNSRIRKVNTLGIITTAVVGSGLSWPVGVSFDTYGNMYIANGSGILKVVPGGSISSYSGPFSNVQFIVAGDSGKVYVADAGNEQIAMADNLGTMHIYAGTGTAGFSGDLGPATAAELHAPSGICRDAFNTVYFADQVNNRIRKIDDILPTPNYVADSFYVSVIANCLGASFKIVANTFSAGKHVKTWFGNGNTVDVLLSAYSTKGYTYCIENYLTSGTYTIKHVLYNGSTPLDSISYSQNIALCQQFTVKYYLDGNSNCTMDNSENFIRQGTLTEVDSNGVPVDTISATSGFNYLAYANSGTVYSFKLLTTFSGVEMTCPLSGVITDTFLCGTQPVKFAGLACISATSFDVGLFANSRSGPLAEVINMYAYNNLCAPVSSILTMRFDPKYHLYEAIPSPSSVIGNTITWNLGMFSILNSPEHFYTHLETYPSSSLAFGDTNMAECVITPTAGDIDTVNNYCVIIDTIKSGFDPNEMWVSPGCIESGLDPVLLRYTIQFENTGNDTAHNIYLLDTLPNNVNISTLRMEMASNEMYITKLKDGYNRNILKFDFPQINLLDSSHHGLCDGTLIFNIKTNAGIIDGMLVQNRAGIYFDDNPVVMTNQVTDIVGCWQAGVPTLTPTNPVVLYPNPGTNQLTIKTEVGTYTSFTISNLVGQQMIQQQLNTTETKVDIVALPAGVYFVTFKGESGNMVKKFVKM